MPNLTFIKPDSNPALAAARELFGTLKPRKGACAFARHFVIAPAKDALRDIEYELSKMAAQKSDCAVAGLRFLTPEAFLNLAQSDDLPPVAERIEAQFAMQQALKDLSPDDMENLVANPKAASDPSRLENLARQILKVRALCAESGKTLNDAFQILSSEIFCDINKFEALAKLEKIFLKKLELTGKIDASGALLKACKNPSAKLAKAKIFLAALPDAPPVFFELLKTLESSLCTEISSFVISELREGFDAFGRPLGEFWRQKILDLKDSQISVCPDIKAQAKLLANEALKIESAPDNLALAAQGGESELAIISELQSEGLDGFSPSGRKLSESLPFKFLELLKVYFETPDFFNFSALLRCEPFLNFLASSFDRNLILLSSDKILEEKLPESLDSALALISKNSDTFEFLNFANDFLKGRESEGSCEKIGRILDSVFSNFKTRDECACEALEALAKTLLDIKNCFALFGDEGLARTISKLLEFADSRVFKDSRKGSQIYIKNWLEIFWSDRAQIYLADFNDGIVPESAGENPFLTDSTRAKLGIRNSALRHARDAYFLHTLLSSRGQNLQIFVPKIDVNGDALKPSRLLLQTGTSELAKRAKLLFSEVESDKASSHFEKSWNLKIPRAPLPTRLRATDFKAYMKCPFEFYLTRVLGLETFDPLKSESTPGDLGTLMHAALQQLAECDSKDEAKIREFLLNKSGEIYLKKFGPNPPAAVELQRYFLEQKLARAAAIEAAHRAEGWRILRVEKPCLNLKIGAFDIVGRMDRLDVSESGDYMLIDYKSSIPKNSQNKSPAEAAHLKGADLEPDSWTDLQLPLYAENVAREFGAETIFCAYFTLPDALSDSSLIPWAVDSTIRNSALSKAEEIAEKISERKFAPSEKSEIAKHFPLYFDFADSIADYLSYE